MAWKNNGEDRSHVIYFQNKHHIHTLKVMASGEWVESYCCWIAVVWFKRPFWKVPSICSNIDLQDFSKAGTNVASTLVLSASYKIQTTPHLQGNQIPDNLENIKTKFIISS
jgi:hypothetical protein